MKLHLPKQLFSALLTAITLAAAPAAWGLVITGIGSQLETIKINAGISYAGANVTYTVANGFGSIEGYNAQNLTLTFDWRYTEETSGAVVMYIINNDASTIGVYMNTSGDNNYVTGYYKGSEWTSKGTPLIEGVASVEEVEGVSIATVSAKIGQSGTYLYKSTDISDNNKLYNADSLKHFSAWINTVKYNTALVENIYIKEYSTFSFSNDSGWSCSYSRTGFNNAYSSPLSVAAGSFSYENDVVAGGVGGLTITATEEATVSLGNTMYLAAPAEGKNTITINNAGAVELSGYLYLVENASIASTGAGDITISRTVTDKNVPSDTESETANGAFTLSLSGTGYNFTGAVDVTGIHLAEGAEATFHNLTIGSTITNNGILNLNTDLRASDASVFDIYEILNAEGEAHNGFIEGEWAVRYDAAQGGTINLKEGAHIYLGADTTTGTALHLTESKDAVYFVDSTAGFAENVYYVTTAAETSSIQVAEGKTLDHFHVTSTGTLTVNGNVTNGANKDMAGILTSTTGTGKLVLDTNLTLNNPIETVFKGDLQVNSNKTLVLGDDQNDAIDISTLNSLILNGGTVKWEAQGTRLNQLKVTDTSGMTFLDMKEGTTLSVGSVVIDPGVTFTVNETNTVTWKHNVNIDMLTGQGSMEVAGPGAGEGKPSSFTIGSLQGFTGNLTITGGNVTNDVTKNKYTASVNTGAAGAAFNSLTFTTFSEAGNISTAVFNVQGNTTIGTLSAAGATVNIIGGKTLTLGNGVDASTHNIGTLTGGTGSKLNLAENAVLNTITSVTGSITMTGTGVYCYSIPSLNKSSATYSSAITLHGTDWTGTIRLSGGNENVNLTSDSLATYKTGNSKLEFYGLHAYAQNGTITPDLILTNTTEDSITSIAKENLALRLDNGTSSYNQSASFTGAISGTGSMAYIWGTGGDTSYKSTYKFEGDTSSWDGWFMNHETSGKYVEVEFTKGGQVFDEAGNGGVIDRREEGSSRTNVIVSASDANALTTFNGSISNVNTLTVSTATDFKQTVGVNTLSVSANSSFDKALSVSGTATVGNNITLTLGNGVEASTHNIGTLNAGEGAVITLNTGATLNALTKGTGTVTLKGSGIYNLGINTASNVSGLDQATWTGTVKINDTKLSIADLSTFGNANSTISVSKIQGELPTQTTEQTIQSHIILEPVSNASCFDLVGTSAANLTFTGKISGSGNMGTAENSAAGHKITFAGDVTDWTGIYWASQASTITYSGNAKVINNEITAGAGTTSTVLYKNSTGMIVNGNINNQLWTNGTLNLQILNENNATGKVVFTGAVVKGTTNLTVEENASAEFTNTSVKLNTVDVKEGATLSFATLNAQNVTNSGALNLGTAATITKAEGATAATMTKVQMSSAGISSAATDSTKGSISNALIDLQNATSFSISDMTLSNVSLKAAAAGTELSLNNVDAQEVELTSGQFTMGGEVALIEQTSAAKSGGYTASFSSDQLSGITLNNAGGAATLTVDLGSLPGSLTMGQTYDELTITLYGFTMMDYEAGKGLIFAEDSWLGRLLADQGASKYVSGSIDSREVAALANNNTVKVVFSSAVENGANVGTVIRITGLTIPEPATTTLGLVALAALVTRRRRK